MNLLKQTFTNVTGKSKVMWIKDRNKYEQCLIKIPGVASLFFALPLIKVKKKLNNYEIYIWVITTILSVLCDFFYTGEEYSIFIKLDRIWAKFMCMYLLNIFSRKKERVYKEYKILLMFCSILSFSMSTYCASNEKLFGYIIFHSYWHILASYTSFELI